SVAERLLDRVGNHFQGTSSRCGEAGGWLDRYGGLKFSARLRPQKEQYAVLVGARKLFNASSRSWPEVAAAAARSGCCDGLAPRTATFPARSGIVASVT
ncbi:MAG TPA: hypothetical protein VGL05_37850, partial [Kribbella sp.]